MGLSPEQIGSIADRSLAIRELLGTEAEQLFKQRLDIRKIESAETKAERERLINIQKGREREVDITTKQLGLGQELRQEDIVGLSRMFHDPTTPTSDLPFIEEKLKGLGLSRDELMKAMFGESIFKDPAVRLLQDPEGNLREVPKGSKIPAGYTTPTETTRDLSARIAESSEARTKAAFNTPAYRTSVERRVIAKDPRYGMAMGPEQIRERDFAIAREIASDMRTSGIAEYKNARAVESPSGSGNIFIVRPDETTGEFVEIKRF